MKRHPATPAEKLRRHAIVFQLAQSLQVTPREAELELDRQDAAARWQATRTRFLAKVHANPRIIPEPPIHPVQWWQKD